MSMYNLIYKKLVKIKLKNFHIPDIFFLAVTWKIQLNLVGTPPPQKKKKKKKKKMQAFRVKGCPIIWCLNLFMDFSENYIFGKFDTFCKRLVMIKDMIETMEKYSGVGNVRIEGIDVIAVRYKTIVDATMKKSYDILDHRKGEVRITWTKWLSDE